MSWGRKSVAMKNEWPVNSTIRASPSRSTPVMTRGTCEKEDAYFALSP